MEEHNVRTWGGFLSRLAKIRRALDPGWSDLLFRGQADSRWSLQTTLERRRRDRMLVLDYYRLIGSRVKPQLESITGRTFEAPSYQELDKLLGVYDDFSLALSFGRFPAYSYLIYTRHHGFPSPLLDWTQSESVAAFFAFASPSPATRRRSIYVWSQSPTQFSGTHAPRLQRLGRFVKTHQRHVLQRCEYSICVDFAKQKWRFSPHDEVFAADEDHAQRVWKINIPSRERLKVLKHLDSANVNAYSLFGSEESFMETMAIRELELDG